MATAGSRNSATVCEASTSSTQEEAEVQQENTLKLKLKKAKKDLMPPLVSRIMLVDTPDLDGAAFAGGALNSSHAWCAP